MTCNTWKPGNRVRVTYADGSTGEGRIHFLHEDGYVSVAYDDCPDSRYIYPPDIVELVEDAGQKHEG